MIKPKILKIVQCEEYKHIKKINQNKDLILTSFVIGDEYFIIDSDLCLEIERDVAYYDEIVNESFFISLSELEEIVDLMKSEKKRRGELK